MSNDLMKPNRFLRWCKHKKMHAFIVNALKSGSRIQVTTYTKSTIYTAKWLDLFSYDKRGVYVVHGKRKDDISLCSIRSV